MSIGAATVVSVDELTERLPFSPAAIRVGLVAFVLAWILGPAELRAAVPIWIVFVVALGLELNFLVGAIRGTRAHKPERGPQAVDRKQLGYEGDADELLLVEHEGEELWIPYSGETDDELDDLIAEAREHDADEPGADRPDVVAVGERTRWEAVRRFLTGVGVIGALALVLWFVEGRTGWDSLAGDTRAAAAERFSAEASRIAGKDVDIRCDESRDYVGYVQHTDGVALVGGDRAYLTPERCHDLYRLAFEDDVASSQTGRAIAVLAHEAWHLRGSDDEGETECFALQSGVELGVRLGLSEGTARRLMRQQLVENQLRSGGSVEYRVPAECRDGGRLDLAPAESGFP
jgi:hypothetical protein